MTRNHSWAKGCRGKTSTVFACAVCSSLCSLKEIKTNNQEQQNSEKLLPLSSALEGERGDEACKAKSAAVKSANRFCWFLILRLFHCTQHFSAHSSLSLSKCILQRDLEDNVTFNSSIFDLV